MEGRRDYVEGFRISRVGDSLLIEATDYHSQPLRLSEDDLAELGLRFKRRREPRGGPRSPRKGADKFEA